jgi:hypothetical protein
MVLAQSPSINAAENEPTKKKFDMATCRRGAGIVFLIYLNIFLALLHIFIGCGDF